jgi:hypothetical protein
LPIGFLWPCWYVFLILVMFVVPRNIWQPWLNRPLSESASLDLDKFFSRSWVSTEASLQL